MAMESDLLSSPEDHADDTVAWKAERGPLTDIVIAFLEMGRRKSHIPAILHIDKATISRIKTKALVDGLIEDIKRGLCKFTAKGQRQLGDYNISSLSSC